MELPPDVEASFTKIIDSILAASDLNTISEKRIRKGLQQAVEYDITPQKEPIKALIMARFDIFNAEKNTEPQINGHLTATNGHPNGSIVEPKQASPAAKFRDSVKREAEEDKDDALDTPSNVSPKKKRKVEHVDDDAAFAARLQAEENGRARATRGGVSKKPVSAKKKKKTPKKKTSDKVKAEDDSDLDGSGSEAAERKVSHNSGFHKLFTLSTPLSALLGEVQLSRPQTVKKIWAYVKENDLQDPKDKRMLMCDGPMKAVFKQEKVHMFTMNKLLGPHLYAPDE